VLDHDVAADGDNLPRVLRVLRVPGQAPNQPPEGSPPGFTQEELWALRARTSLWLDTLDADLDGHGASNLNGVDE